MQETKELKSISPKESQQIQENHFFQTYKNYSDNFQKQMEKTITQRSELFGKVYLEYVKHCKQITDNMLEYENDFLTRNGLKIDVPETYNEAFKKFYESFSTVYSNQARIAETTLNVMEQNLKLLNGNMGSFTDLMLSIGSWWIPPTTTKN
ncbi:hypothetical protein YTPLAS73_01710 [Nitrosarchaeum sp.]|nr:hypothetical protein YTPLAS73_01710 [Nitrosarchaeum sp.]